MLVGTKTPLRGLFFGWGFMDESLRSTPLDRRAQRGNPEEDAAAQRRRPAGVSARSARITNRQDCRLGPRSDPNGVRAKAMDGLSQPCLSG